MAGGPDVALGSTTALASAALPAVSATMMDRNLVLGAAVAAAVAGLVFLRARPKAAVVVWFAVVCFVPTWLEAKAGVLVPPTTLVAAGILVAFVALSAAPRVSVADGLVGALVVTCLAGALIGGSGADAVIAVVLRWMIPFLLGRVILSRVTAQWLYRVAAVMFVVVAVLAVLEFATSFNPFVLLHVDNVDYTTWAPLQERGGLLRVEGAFGHSIALGASMAMALPLILATTWRFAIKLVLVAVILGAEVFTFSRLGLICSVLALVLFVLFSRTGLDGRQRKALSALLIVAGCLATPAVLGNFSRAGSEASLSAEYRSQLADLIPDMSVLGPADNTHRTPTGELYFGDFRSIDNALVLLGLTYGYLPLLIAVGLLVVLVVAVVRRRGSPPMIALATQVPAVATVALITQYEMFVWFMVGLTCSLVATGQPQGGLPSRTPSYVSETDLVQTDAVS